WDSMLPDGTINPGEMTSFNHYAFGAIVDWLHRSVAGLGAAAPGYAKLRIAPVPINGLDRASVVQDTPYGRAESGWAPIGEGSLRIHQGFAANTLAEVALPGQAPFEVVLGSHEWVVGDRRSGMEVGQLSWDAPLGAIGDDRLAYDALLREVCAVDQNA